MLFETQKISLNMTGKLAALKCHEENQRRVFFDIAWSAEFKSGVRFHWKIWNQSISELLCLAVCNCRLDIDKEKIIYLSYIFVVISTWWILYLLDSESVSEVFKSFPGELFGEDISHHILGRTVL